MISLHSSLVSNPNLSLTWKEGTSRGALTRREVAAVSTVDTIAQLRQIVVKNQFPLRVNAILLHGAVRIHSRKCDAISKEALAVRRRLVLHFGEAGSLDLHLQRPGDRALTRVQPIDDSFLRAPAHASAPMLNELEPLPAFDDDAMVDFFVQGHIGCLLTGGGVDGPGSGLATPTPSPSPSTYTDVLESMARRRPDAPPATATPLRAEHLEGLEQHLRDVLGSPEELQQQQQQQQQKQQQAGAAVEAQEGARNGAQADDMAFDGAGEDALEEEADRPARGEGDEQQPEAPTGSALEGATEEASAAAAAAAAAEQMPTSKLAALAAAANEEEQRVADLRDKWAMEEKLRWTGGHAMSAASVARLRRQLIDDGITTLSDDAFRAMQRRVDRTVRRSRRPRRRQALEEPVVARELAPIRGLTEELWAPHRDLHLLPGLTGGPAPATEAEAEGDHAAPDAGDDHGVADDGFDGAGEDAFDERAAAESAAAGAEAEAIAGQGSPAPSLPPTAVDDDIEALRAAGSTPSRRRQRGSVAPSRSGTRPNSPRSLGAPGSRPQTPHSANEPGSPQRLLAALPDTGLGDVDAGEIRLADGLPDAPASERRRGPGHAAVAALRPQSLRFISALQAVREGDDADGGDFPPGESRPLDTTLPELVRPAQRKRHRKFAAWMFLQTLELMSSEVIQATQSRPYGPIRITEGPLFDEAVRRAAQVGGTM